jgi:hypothetical protein
MTPQMRAVFETENLANATPATVSRAGIVYVSEVSCKLQCCLGNRLGVVSLGQQWCCWNHSIVDASFLKEDLGWSSLLVSWLIQRCTGETQPMQQLFDKLVAPVLHYCRHDPCHVPVHGREMLLNCHAKMSLFGRSGQKPRLLWLLSSHVKSKRCFHC